jgi:rubrerythrin
MKINLELIKKDCDIGISMSDSFYEDVIYFQLSIYKYAEKFAYMMYKRIGHPDWAKDEKRHSRIFNRIVKDKLFPLEPLMLQKMKMISKYIKTNNFDIVRAIVNVGEFFATKRYNTISKYVEDLESSNLIKSVVKDEGKHFNELPLGFEKYKSMFESFEGTKLYQKYKNELNMSYHEFVKKIESTSFHKSMVN